jgi:hypothetical protein
MSTTPLQSDRRRCGNSRSKLKMIRTGPRAADTMTDENNVWSFDPPPLQHLHQHGGRLISNAATWRLEGRKASEPAHNLIAEFDLVCGCPCT